MKFVLLIGCCVSCRSRSIVHRAEGSVVIGQHPPQAVGWCTVSDRSPLHDPRFFRKGFSSRRIGMTVLLDTLRASSICFLETSGCSVMYSRTRSPFLTASAFFISHSKSDTFWPSLSSPVIGSRSRMVSEISPISRSRCVCSVWDGCTTGRS